MLVDVWLCVQLFVPTKISANANNQKAPSCLFPDPSWQGQNTATRPPVGSVSSVLGSGCSTVRGSLSCKVFLKRLFSPPGAAVEYFNV